MSQTIPSQCPECSEIAVDVSSVPPDRHDQGDRWATRAKCGNCGEFVGWY
ncbi:hypothetical protein [Halobellus limi]|nr:hypothetical protein [Halobellus limi]